VIAEAMARGKVVVATGWSGNMDFMTANNSLPVDYRLVALQVDEGPYRRGERWAEPSQDDAVGKLRLVAADTSLRRRLGERARQDCEAWLSPPAVAGLVRSRLLKILRDRNPTPP
jgi:glycosyltransferase involved in cell wall biosynthesis